MIIDFISDTHGNYKHLEGKLTGDVLVHCGDFSREGSEEEQEEFIKWIAEQPHKHKIVVPGNHDRFVEKQHNRKFIEDFSEVFSEWEDYYLYNTNHNGSSVMGETNLHLLINGHLTIEGVKFYGMPYTQFYNNWAWAYDNNDHARELCEAIPEDTDVLITHGPAMGILDENSHRHQLGCPFLLEAIKRVEPRVHAFGHVHESRGIKLLAGTHLNVAQGHYQMEVWQFRTLMTSSVDKEK